MERQFRNMERIGFGRGMSKKVLFIRKYVLFSGFQRSERHFIWYLCFNFWHSDIYSRFYHCSSGIIYILQINNFFSPQISSHKQYLSGIKDWLDLQKSVSTKSGENGSFSFPGNIHEIPW